MNVMEEKLYCGDVQFRYGSSFDNLNPCLDSTHENGNNLASVLTAYDSNSSAEPKHMGYIIEDLRHGCCCAGWLCWGGEMEQL